MKPSALAALMLALGCSRASTGPKFIENLGWIAVTPDSVSLSAAPGILVDGFRELRATVYDFDGHVIPDVAPTWASSNSSIASVSSAGIVVGGIPGDALITAAIGRQAQASVPVRVIPEPDSLIAVAHRGFPVLFPENTLLAINGAFGLGAGAIEVDVRWTRDGTPILMHDATVDRTTSGTGAVSNLTLFQVQQLDACAKFRPSPGQCPVPTLHHALEAARGRGKLLLHLYGPFPSGALISLLGLIDSTSMRQEVVIISFDYPVLRELRRLDPVAPLGYLTMQLPNVADLVALKRAAAMPEKAALLQDPIQGKLFLQSAAKSQVEVIAWTVAETADARALVDLGVRRVLSDIPLDSREFLP